jgi:hypothetical protein
MLHWLMLSVSLLGMAAALIGIKRKFPRLNLPVRASFTILGHS